MTHPEEANTESELTRDSPDEDPQPWVYQGHGQWTMMDDAKQLQDTTKFKQVSKTQERQLQADNEDLMLTYTVNRNGYPNRYGARIPIKTKWDLGKMETLLEGYHDREVVEWMKYGWPTGRLPTLPSPALTFKNHKGAVEHPQALQKYIDKEMTKGAVLGPFKHIPFTSKVGIAPISTRPKKNTTERRVIIDLSFPPGESVNDGMIKDNYMGEVVKLTFPRVDDLALRIYQLGPGAMMFKIDLSRYFRQLPLDPGDYSMIGYVINNQLYFDKVLPMGMRTAPYIAQRVTNAIAHIHQQMGFFLLNYVDDFLGAEEKEWVWKAYKHLTELLEQLKVDTAPEKITPPTTRIEFLGITLDSESMTMEIPQDKLTDITQELHSWLYRTTATRKEVESLVGKLQFMGKCIKAEGSLCPD